MLQKASMVSEIIRQSIIPDDPYRLNPEDVERCCPMLMYTTIYCLLTNVTRPSIRGTPIQSGPDYVLNPLSIFRMARKIIPEGHAPGRVTSPSTSNAQHSAYMQPQHLPHVNSHDGLGTNSFFAHTPTDQATFDELQTFLTSDLGWTWQPAGTAVGSGTETAGLSPWVPSVLPDSVPTGVDPQLDFSPSAFLLER